MIRAEQSRAARAYLDWSRSDLSARSGVSAPAITEFEAGRSRPGPDTVEKLVSAFTAHGIEFTENSVVRREDGIRTISGEDCYLRLLDDVLESSCDELLIWCSSDKASPPAVNEKYRALRKKGVGMRQLVSEGDEYLMGELSEYRCLPKRNFVNVVKLTYGDRHATVNGPESRVIIHRDSGAAESHRQIFNVLWEMLKQPAKSTAHEKF